MCGAQHRPKEGISHTIDNLNYDICFVVCDIAAGTAICFVVSDTRYQVCLYECLNNTYVDITLLYFYCVAYWYILVVAQRPG